MGKEYIELTLERLKFSVEPSASIINLYWDGVKCTKGHGFISIIGTNNCGRYYSDKALWQAGKVSDNELELLLRRPNLPITQLWNITLKNETTIDWKVSISPAGEIDISEQEIGLMLSPDYTKWLNSFEGGSFPKITPGKKEWELMQHKSLLTKSIGVRSCVKNGLYRPAIILNFGNTEHYTEPKIRNSHFSADLRGLSVLIKHNENFRINSINNIFAGEIKIIDNNIELAKHINFCKKEDRRIFLNEGNLKGQENLRENIGLFSHLVIRFRFHYNSKGFLYAAYRGIVYIIFCLRTYHIEYILLDFLRFKRQIKDKGGKYKLELGNLKLLINAAERSIQIYWDGEQLTKYCGFITVIGDNTRKRYYSHRASWKVSQSSPNQASIVLAWLGFPVEQRWKIAIGEDKIIDWNIEIVPKRKIILGEKETGIILSKDYTRWINSYEEGEFLKITPDKKEWEEVEFWNLSSKSIGVRSCVQNDVFKPAIIIDFGETNLDTEPKIRNSDYHTNSRCLLVQVKASNPVEKYSMGRPYNIFSGKIKIIENDEAVNKHIIECKKRLYRERIPFIEEKIPRNYLSKILKPIEVILVNLPWKEGERWGVRAGSRWPHIKEGIEAAYLPFPFFLAYTAALLLKSGISVRIIDAIAENIDYANFINLVNELEPTLLIAEVSTPSLKNDLDILKKINKKNTKIAICGTDFNIRQQNFLKENNFIDFVMIDEYEYTALELFESIKEVRSFKGVAGLIYKENGDIKVNSPRPLVSDLDKLPWPLREQLPMERYIDAPGKIPYPSVQMWASRGCPFQCTFCVWPQLIYNNNRYRMRDAKFIVDEMEYLVKERKFKSVYFDDDTFNISKKNVLNICREIKARSLDVSWAIMARADTMDEEMLIKMKDAGLQAVKYGVESAEQKLLDNICKNMNLKQAERMIRFTKSLGIRIHLTFAFGLPEETKDTIKKTIDYAIELNPDTVQFSIMTPYPGTEYYKQLDAKGYIVSKNWSDYNGASKSVVRTECLSPEDLENAKDMALRMWKRHRRRNRSIITMPFDKELRAAFKYNLESKGFLHTLAKTARYIYNG